MAMLIPNTFSSYVLTPEEDLTGSTFTFLQLCVLRNKLAQVAQDKLNLEFDVTCPNKFIQHEAYLKGQLDTIQWLLDFPAVPSHETQDN